MHTNSSVIYLVNLQYILENYSAPRLTWLPNLLPPHVRIVVSTLEGSELTCSSLKKRLTDVEGMFKESERDVIDLSHVLPVEAVSILDDRLKEICRSITDKQREQFRVAVERLAFLFLYKDIHLRNIH